MKLKPKQRSLKVNCTENQYAIVCHGSARPIIFLTLSNICPFQWFSSTPPYSFYSVSFIVLGRVIDQTEVDFMLNRKVNVLKLQLNDIQDRKLILREPKSGKEHEIVFIPQKLADRLRDYATKKCKTPQDRIFPISYEAARMIVVKAGMLVGIHLRPHDLRRHSATYASTFL